MGSAPPRPDIPDLARTDLVLRTPRLVLRPLARADVDALFVWVKDPELPRMMSWAAHTSRDETAAFVQIVIGALEKGEGITWVLEHQGKLSGLVGFDGLQWTLRAWRVDRAELGYWLAPPLWGRGLMSEAAEAAVRFGFETLGLHKVTVGCLEENLASRRIIEKLGFRWVGKLIDDVWRDGRWWTHLRWELLREEWAAR
jgi:ribosomal-protein-alanine N-acetyltransferase